MKAYSSEPIRPVRVNTPALIARVDNVDQARLALAEGADLLDVTDAGQDLAEQIRARHPAAGLWDGDPDAVVDVDLLDPNVPGPPGTAHAGVAAAAAIVTWTATAGAVRTRHTRPARRAIDMAATIAGRRAPALTVRGLA